MSRKNSVGGMTKISVGKVEINECQLISLGKKNNPRNILYWFCHLRGHASIDFCQYILGFCVAIYFYENPSAYAVGG